MDSQAKNIRFILKELFTSEEMASYLAKCLFSDRIDCQRNGQFDDAPPEKLPLCWYQIADVVTDAPVSLERKRELFVLLAENEEDGFFSILADAASQIIQEMQSKPGDFFYLIACSYKEDTACAEEERVGAFLTWEHICEAIQEYCGGYAQDEDSLTWFYVEKWMPDRNGRLKNTYSYEVISEKACFCYCEDFSAHERLAFGGCTDLNLPVPFHAGDIVTIDCRPFAPVSRALILETGDNCDCCCLQALYHAGDGIWNTGAVKHGHIFPDHIFPKLSPLYRLASFHGKLPKEERLLEKVSSYLNGNERKGNDLWNYIHSLGGRKEKNGVTEVQILSYLESAAQ